MATVVKETDPKRKAWRADFRDQNNKRRKKWFDRKADAEKWLRAKVEEVEKGTYIPESRVPTFEAIAADFLETKKHNVRDTTLEQYRQHIECHLNPALGEIKVNRVKYPEINAYMLGKLEALQVWQDTPKDKRTGKKAISRSTIRKTIVTLGSVLKHAARSKYCEYNPSVDLPEVPQEEVRREEKRVRYFDHEQAVKLIAAADKKNQKIGTLIFVAIFTGLRQGELLGLEWPDVDLDQSVIHVRRSFNHNKVRDTKSEASYRTVDLGKEAVRRLREWKIACPPTERNLVFPSNVGNHINARNLYNRVYKPLLEKAELPDLTFHELRHTYATLMLDNGVDAKRLQAQMGHTTIDLIYKTYGHLIEDRDRTAANSLEQRVLGAGRDKDQGACKRKIRPRN